MPNYAQELFENIERGMVLRIPRPEQEGIPPDKKVYFYIAVLAAVGEVLVITRPESNPDELSVDHHIYLMWSIRHNSFVHVKYHIIAWDYKHVSILPEKRHDLVKSFDALHVKPRTSWVEILGLPPHTGTNAASS